MSSEEEANKAIEMFNEKISPEETWLSTLPSRKPKEATGREGRSAAAEEKATAEEDLEEEEILTKFTDV